MRIRDALIATALLCGCGNATVQRPATKPTASDQDEDAYLARDREMRAKEAEDAKARDAEHAKVNSDSDAAIEKERVEKRKLHVDSCLATFAARRAAVRAAIIVGRKDEERAAVILAWAKKNCSVVNTEATQVKKTGTDTVEVKSVGDSQDLKCKTAGKPPELTTAWYHEHAVDASNTSYYRGDESQRNMQCRDVDALDLTVGRGDAVSNDKIVSQ